MGCKINIASLFLNLDDFDNIRPGRGKVNSRTKLRGFHEAREFFGQEKGAHMYRNFRHGTERSEVKLLASWRVFVDPA